MLEDEKTPDTEEGAGSGDAPAESGDAPAEGDKPEGSEA